MLHGIDIEAAVQDCNSPAAHETPSLSHAIPYCSVRKTRSTI